MINFDKLETRLQEIMKTLEFGINVKGEILSYDVVYAVRQQLQNIVFELDAELDKIDNKKKQAAK